MTPTRSRARGWWAAALVAGVLLAAAPGCGREPGLVLHPVQGRVLVGDKVVKKGTVQLRANQAKGNTTWEQPSGTIAEDGTFELTTAGRLGAPAGWYKVLVMADNFEVVDPPPSPVWPNYPEGFLKKPLVHERYLQFNQTDVEIEVLATPPEGGYVLRLNP